MSSKFRTMVKLVSGSKFKVTSETGSSSEFKILGLCRWSEVKVVRWRHIVSGVRVPEFGKIV